MSKLLNVGKIVLDGLLYARQDGRIDHSELLTIVNQCANEIGLNLRFSEVNENDPAVNKHLSELKDIEKLRDENNKLTFKLFQQGQDLDEQTLQVKNNLNEAIEKSPMNDYPADASQPMTRIMQVNISDQNLHKEATKELEAARTEEHERLLNS